MLLLFIIYYATKCILEHNKHSAFNVTIYYTELEQK